MSKESHADTALQIAGAIEALGHATQTAIESTDWPGGLKPSGGEFWLTGLEPEVVDLLAGEDAPSPAHWSKPFNNDGAHRSGTVKIAGIRVAVLSRLVPGQMVTEFVRKEEA